jgi:transcriptional regulator GlxA family with amidase domain
MEVLRLYAVQGVFLGGAVPVTEAVDLDNVARASGLSRRHFNHLFRSCTGVSPRVYVNALRVETAVGRLRRYDTEIGSISEDLGFSAHGNFTRFFRQHTGTSSNLLEIHAVSRFCDRLRHHY